VDAPLEEGAQPSFDTAIALRRLASIALTVGLTATVTYLIPSFERVRPWVQGEGVPVVRLFTTDRTQPELPDFQGAAAAAQTETPAPLPAAKPVPAPAPVTNKGPKISPAEYAGLVMPIEHPDLLASFYDALTRSAEGTPGAITRIAHYGDSAVAADEISCTARRKLQLRFGDAGHGFMLTARGNMYYGHRDVVHRESGGWELYSIVPGKLHSGLYGYGGVAATGRTGDYTYFGTVSNGPIGRSVSRFELFYQRYNDGGELRLSVDGAPEQVLETRADDSEDAFELIQVPDGEHSLAIRARGDVRLYGVSQERDVPGVVYDALGLVGARASRLLDADPKHMAAQIAHRDPDLLVLGFGGNEAGNDKLDMNRYAATLTKVIHMMRAGKPSMACLLFGPLDQGERNERGDVVTLPALPGIVEVQRRVSAAEGCAFFDTYAAMGGKGSVGRWYHARPRMFSPDFRHATPTGYAAIGEMYYQALLKGFADYLAEK
jgi:lysophospholipase L1-like esterase